ncbi:MAG: hypothetical protein LBD51_08225 [Bifidobacteriaceae bacterium]|jgi:uncharacterized repeat protein (TIGR01451 family)|nr:hypothetical protein [Bifidobacteriaceae bacterium]
MYHSKLRSRVAAATVAALAAGGLALAAPSPGASAATTHHRPGIEGVNKVYDWSAATGSARTSDTWRVYAKQGEVVRGVVEGIHRDASGAPNPLLAYLPATPQMRVQLLAPGGAVVGSCLATGAESKCEASAAAPRDGVYSAVWDSPNLVADGAQIYYRKDLWVTAAGADVVGRVFTTAFTAEQNTRWQTRYPDEFGEAGLVDLATQYVLGDDGTLFRVDMHGFHGISSGMQADSVGIYEAATCRPSDKSSTHTGFYSAPAYVTQPAESNPCGRKFLIFPDRPAADLPEALTAAEGWDGPVYPRYQVPETPRVAQLAALEPADPARPYAVEATLDLGAFKGTYQVGADVNGDGDLADAADVVERLEKLTTAADPLVWRWDGRDAAGQAVGRSAKPKVMVQLVRGNRYSLVLGDVEQLTGGVRIEQLAGYQVAQNGGQPVLPNIHWDDSDVEAHNPAGQNPLATLTTEPKLVKTPPEGVAQTGHLHGWDVPPGGANDDSWGNAAGISFNIWNDLSADAALVASRELASRELSVESKAGELRPAQGGARRIEYTVKVKNTGTAAFTQAAPAVMVDTLPLRMDDWRYSATAYSASTSPAAAAAAFAEGKLTWSGPLAPGETATLTYSGRVLPGFEASRVNTAATGPCPAPSDDGVRVVTSLCDGAKRRAEVPLPGLQVEKTADVAAVHTSGQVARYTVTLTNIGQAAYTEADPARVVDDLSQVLDDSVLDVASISPPGARWDAQAQTITWSGPLAQGAKQAISYTVAYAPGAADLLLDNTAWIYPEDVIDQTPGAKARVAVPGSDLHLSKRAEPAQAEPGDEVRYLVTLDNSRGQAAAPVAWTDDLSGVLDDAALKGAPVVSGAGLTARLEGASLVLGGSVAAGAKATVAYTAVVSPRPGPAGQAGAGDGVLVNALLGACAEGPCPPPLECRQDDPLTTCTPVLAYRVAKEAAIEPPGAEAQAGAVVTFRLSFANTGGAEVEVAEVDDLTGVLDDADVGEVDLAAAGALAARREGGQLRISGLLPVGAVAVVAYQAQVRPPEARGDSVLENVVAPSGVTTRTPVGELAVAKSAAPKRAKPGEQVEYTIQLRATGALAQTVNLVDDLAGALDDGAIVAPPVSDNPAIAVDYEAGAAVIGLAGQLAAGQEANVKYKVQVRPEAEIEDWVLTNVVLERGYTPADGPRSCSAYAVGRCTSTPVDVPIDPADPPALALTGAAAGWAGGLAGALVAAGLALLAKARRRPRRAV